MKTNHLVGTEPQAPNGAIANVGVTHYHEFKGGPGNTCVPSSDYDRQSDALASLRLQLEEARAALREIDRWTSASLTLGMNQMKAQAQYAALRKIARQALSV